MSCNVAKLVIPTHGLEGGKMGKKKKKKENLKQKERRKRNI